MKAEYRVFQFHEKWACRFLVDGRPHYEAHGTDGTGIKLYETESKAVAAGKRYTKKMTKLGFTE